MINQERALSIAKKLYSPFDNGIEWDNDEKKWYLSNAQIYDNIMSFAEYVINNIESL
jgi:hypothetical protein